MLGNTKLKFYTLYLIDSWCLIETSLNNFQSLIFCALFCNFFKKKSVSSLSSVGNDRNICFLCRPIFPFSRDLRYWEEQCRVRRRSRRSCNSSSRRHACTRPINANTYPPIESAPRAIKLGFPYLNLENFVVPANARIHSFVYTLFHNRPVNNRVS